MRKSYIQNTGGLSAIAAAFVGINMALSSQGETSSPVGFANAASVSRDELPTKSISLLQMEIEQEEKIATGLRETLANAQKLEVEDGLSKKEALIESSLMELGRYFNSKDEPIDLSQSNNHARIVLNRRSRNLA